MTQEEMETLKIRTIDACLKGYSFRLGRIEGITTIYLSGHKSFWSVIWYANGQPEWSHIAHTINLKDLHLQIDWHWQDMDINKIALRELDYWIPKEGRIA